MQKIKEVLTGASHDNNNTASSTGSRTSREYTSGSPTSTQGLSGNGAQGYSTADRLTGDRDSSLTGSNRNLESASSGLTGQQTGLGGNHLGGQEHHHSHGTSSSGGALERGAERLTGDRTTGTTGSSSLVGGREGSLGNTGSSLTGKHAHGHDSALASKFDPSAETTHHDHKHLQHVTQRDVRHIETEEVERQREIERNIHHVQHHVQPIVAKEVTDEVHHNTIHPTTTIREQHVNTEEDVNLFRGLGEKFRDTETHRAKERTVVDLGERVTENVHHHVHHITQPVIQTEVHDRHRIHTVIPVHQVTHEAPIIHKSSVHEPIALEDFQKGGGVLGSGITMDKANVLQTGECSRDVDGVAERLVSDLHLSGRTHNTSGSSGSGITSGLTGSHHNSGSVGSGLTGSRSSNTTSAI